MQGEGASTDVEAAASFPEDVVKIIKKGGYTKKQIFSVDVTASYWKKMLSRTFIAREVSVWLQSLKGQSDSLVSVNAFGGFKLKPVLNMVY